MSCLELRARKLYDHVLKLIFKTGLRLWIHVTKGNVRFETNEDTNCWHENRLHRVFVFTCCPLVTFFLLHFGSLVLLLSITASSIIIFLMGNKNSCTSEKPLILIFFEV